MFKPKTAKDAVDDLERRLAFLEGQNATLIQFISNRGHIVRCLREKLEPGTVERGLIDLILTLEREAFAKAFALEVAPAQQAGHESFVSTVGRSLRS